MDIINSSDCEELTEAEVNWLQVLVSDWQVVADLAPADLILWLPQKDGRFIAVAHCRPATATTVHIEDILGLSLTASRAQLLHRCMDLRAASGPSAPRWAGSYSVREVVVPVVYRGKAIAALTCESNIGAPTSTAGTASVFSDAADQFLNMIASGEYPYESQPSVAFNGAPRVIDGVVRIDEEGMILGISPNASSCFRRIGVRGLHVDDNLSLRVTQRLDGGLNTVDESLPLVLMGRAAWRTELEVDNATLSLRALPLKQGQKRGGAVVLVRDISEVRRIERQIMSKDAAIREIHHRVKNNLATVSALIRLQGRRSKNSKVKQALSEAERRISTIATVHEALSVGLDQDLDYTDLARKIITNAALLASSEKSMSVTLDGDFGRIDAECATTLSTILAELVANSVEHGYQQESGTVEVRVQRRGPHAIVQVLDRGEGVDASLIGTGLGTKIVRSLVEAELRGKIEWAQRTGGGTAVEFTALVDRHARRANTEVSTN